MQRRRLRHTLVAVGIVAVGAGTLAVAALIGGDAAPAREVEGEEPHASRTRARGDSPPRQRRSRRSRRVGESKIEHLVYPGAAALPLASLDADRVFNVIAEFGNTRHVSFPDSSPLSTAPSSTGRSTTRFRAELPERGQLDALAAGLQPGALRQHVLRPDGELLPRDQSSGRYTVDGDVTEGQGAVGNEARYAAAGDVNNDPGLRADRPQQHVVLIRDAMAFWVKSQLDA